MFLHLHLFHLSAGLYCLLAFLPILHFCQAVGTLPIIGRFLHQLREGAAHVEGEGTLRAAQQHTALVANITHVIVLFEKIDKVQRGVLKILVIDKLFTVMFQIKRQQKLQTVFIYVPPSIRIRLETLV